MVAVILPYSLHLFLIMHYTLPVVFYEPLYVVTGVVFYVYDPCG